MLAIDIPKLCGIIQDSWCEYAIIMDIFNKMTLDAIISRKSWMVTGDIISIDTDTKKVILYIIDLDKSHQCDTIGM